MIGSNQVRGRMLVGTYPVTQDNTQLNVDIPRGPHLESIIIRVNGSFSNGTAYTTVRSNGPVSFIRRAELTLNSNVVLDSGSGQQLYLTNMLRRRLPTLVLPTVSTGAQSFQAVVYLDRCLNDMIRPKDSLLKTDVGVANLQLRLQLGALADMFTGAGASTYTNVSVTVTAITVQEAQTDNGTPRPLFYVKRNGLRVPISAAGSGQQVRINTGNRLRAAMVRVLNASTGEPDDTLVTRVRLQRGGDTRVDAAITDLHYETECTYGQARVPGSFSIDMANPSYASGVKYSEFWPIPSSADTFLLVDTTAACALDLTTIEGVDL